MQAMQSTDDSSAPQGPLSFEATTAASRRTDNVLTLIHVQFESSKALYQDGTMPPPSRFARGQNAKIGVTWKYVETRIRFGCGSMPSGATMEGSDLLESEM